MSTYDVGHLKLDNANGVTSGYYNGVEAYETADYVYINNYGGLIEGRSYSGNGINIGGVYGLNHLVTYSGGEVSGSSIDGNAVYIGNFRNTSKSGGMFNADIVGGYNGINISGVSGGDIWIEGDGLIRGYSGAGININGFSWNVYADNYAGGTIEGWRNAIDIESSGGGGTYIYNQDGSIINQSSSHNTIWVETNQEVRITNTTYSGSGAYIGHDLGSGTTAELANLDVIHVDSYGGSSGGAYAEIVNAGLGAVINGRINLTNNNDVFYNVDGAVWNTGGTNDWGGSTGSYGPHYGNTPASLPAPGIYGAGQIPSGGPEACTYGNCLYNNYAVINVYGNTNFNNLDLFSNSEGIVNMQDGAANVLVVSGSSGGPAFYSTLGYGDGHLALEASLVSGGSAPGQHDLFEIYGFTGAGSTGITVKDLLPGTATSYDAQGIPIVEIVGSQYDAQTFYLDGGPIQKGLWQYALQFAPSCGATPSGSESVSGYDEWQLIMQPGTASTELPTLMTAIQSVGVNTLGLWLDRQADLRAQLGGNGPSADLGDGRHVKPTADIPGEGGGVNGGVWTKLLAGQANRDSSTIYNGLSYDTSYDQSLFGFLAGVDFGHTDSHGGTWLIGPMAGYTSANTNFGSGATAGLTAFTVGGYLTYLNGGLHVDTVAKADMGTIDYKLSGDSDNLATTSWTASTEAGYRFGGGRGFFEPMAAFAYSHTSIADGSILSSTISFGDGNSYRAQAGLRAGFTTISGGNKIEPFIMAAIVDDFGTANTASVTSGLTTFSFSDPGLGVYGQFGAGINVFTSSNMSAFAKADAVVSTGYNNFTGQAGVRWNW